MGSSGNNLDNIVRRKRKTLNIALLSALVTCFFSIGVVVSQYRLAELNQNEMEKLVYQQNIIENGAQKTLSLQQNLNVKEAEIEALKKRISAEKALSQSLKRKLTDTLKLLANAQAVSNSARSGMSTELSDYREITPDVIQVENKNQKMIQSTNDDNIASTVNAHPSSNASEKKPDPLIGPSSGHRTDSLRPVEPNSTVPVNPISGKALSPRDGKTELSTIQESETEQPRPSKAIPTSGTEKQVFAQPTDNANKKNSISTPASDSSKEHSGTAAVQSSSNSDASAEP